MRTRQIQGNPVRPKLIVLRGGIDESLNFNLLPPGKLISSINYESPPGSNSGYRSVRGFEIFDGRPSPSSIDTTINPETGEIDDTDREVARASITAVPGDGNIVGGFEFNDDIYAIRADTTVGYSRVYKATSSGWSEVAQPVGEELSLTGTVRCHQARIDGFNTNNLTIFLVNGSSSPRYFDGTTFTIISDAHLPTGIYPHAVGSYQNRLFLAYNGSLFFSAVGDPADFDPLSNAGEIFLGDRVTNVVEAPGDILVVTTTSFTDLIFAVGYSPDSGWLFKKERFSSSVGGYENTAINMLGDLVWASKSGLIVLKTATEFGDFTTTVLTENVSKSYEVRKASIIGAFLNTDRNIYSLLFSGGYVLSFAFHIDKKPKDVLPIFYKTPFIGFFVFRDVSRKFTYTSTSVFELDKGTSFNGEEIKTHLSTVPHHYGYPGYVKKFLKLQAEVEGQPGLVLSVRGVFNLGDTYFGRGSIFEEDLLGSTGSPWGTAEWGSFTWGVGGINNKSIYVHGLGETLSMSFTTNNKYTAPHTMHSVFIHYVPGKRRN